jgi:hypothetical protein
MKQKAVFTSFIFGLFLTFLASVSFAGSIAIVNGSSVTSETGTTAAITNNLNALEIAVGNTTTILDTLPADISGYDQVWDLRFSNASALTASEQTTYINYLTNGGGLFVMGENSTFVDRNNSIFSLITAAGGGTMTFTTPLSTQTVNAPFTGPNIITDGNVTYAAPGGVTDPGNGQFMTVDTNGSGTGVAFSVGDLTNAPLGALTTVFDVNFMQGTFDQPDSQQFLKNLISFVDVQVNPNPAAVPEPGTILLLGLGLLGLAGREYRCRK